MSRPKTYVAWVTWLGVFLGVNVGLGSCSFAHNSPSPPAAPVVPNESLVTAEVVDIVVVDSATLNILPQQRIVVLTLKILSVKAVGDLLNFLEGKSGETITAYSKDLTLTTLKKMTVTANVSFQGDERGGSFWVRKISSKRPR